MKMSSQKLQEMHPGKVLLEEFIRPMGLTMEQFASDIGVPVSGIVDGRQALTVDTATRLAVYFDMEVRFWLNLQTEYDLRLVETYRTERAFGLQAQSRK